MTMNTEQKVLELVARLGDANTLRVSNDLMISTGYANYLCRYLRREGLLETSNGSYHLSRKGAKLIYNEEDDSRPPITRGEIKRIAQEVAQEIKGIIPKGFRTSPSHPGVEDEGIHIKSDYVDPSIFEDAGLESNVTELIKERIDIERGLDETVAQLKNIKRKEGRKK